MNNHQNCVQVNVDASINCWNDIVKYNGDIRERDKITKDSLEDTHSINFILIPEGITNLPEIDPNDTLPEQFVLTYDKFINNNMCVDNIGLLNANDIVLESSYCNILFNYPVNCYEHTNFTITADDRKIGFRRNELALKAMQKYHLLWYLCKNYDVEKGKIVSNELANERNIIMFKPNQHINEYTQNGLLNLVYDKKRNHWVFNTYNFI